MKITVMGSGSFGLAVANQLIKNNNKVTVWTHDIKSKDDRMKTERIKNSIYSLLYR